MKTAAISRRELERRRNQRLLSASQVLDRTTLSESTLYRQMRAGTFPKPVKVSANRVAWRELDVQTWIDARCAESDAA